MISETQHLGLARLPIPMILNKSRKISFFIHNNSFLYYSELQLQSKIKCQFMLESFINCTNLTGYKCKMAFSLPFIEMYVLVALVFTNESFSYPQFCCFVQLCTYLEHRIATFQVIVREHSIKFTVAYFFSEEK